MSGASGRSAVPARVALTHCARACSTPTAETLLFVLLAMAAAFLLLMAMLYVAIRYVKREPRRRGPQFHRVPTGGLGETELLAGRGAGRARLGSESGMELGARPTADDSEEGADEEEAGEDDRRALRPRSRDGRLR